MEAKELMLFDCVFMDKNYAEEDPIYAKVCYEPYQIKDGEDIDLAKERNCIGDDTIYRPIPLTPEILGLNGFVFQAAWEEWWLPANTDFVLFVGEDYFLLSDISGANIKYVHQLQHALRLVGLSELADNFKVE